MKNTEKIKDTYEDNGLQNLKNIYSQYIFKIEGNPDNFAILSLDGVDSFNMTHSGMDLTYKNFEGFFNTRNWPNFYLISKNEPLNLKEHGEELSKIYDALNEYEKDDKVNEKLLKYIKKTRDQEISVLKNEPHIVKNDDKYDLIKPYISEESSTSKQYIILYDSKYNELLKTMSRLDKDLDLLEYRHVRKWMTNGSKLVYETLEGVGKIQYDTSNPNYIKSNQGYKKVLYIDSLESKNVPLNWLGAFLKDKTGSWTSVIKNYVMSRKKVKELYKTFKYISSDKYKDSSGSLLRKAFGKNVDELDKIAERKADNARLEYIKGLSDKSLIQSAIAVIVKGDTPRKLNENVKEFRKFISRFGFSISDSKYTQLERLENVVTLKMDNVPTNEVTGDVFSKGYPFVSGGKVQPTGSFLGLTTDSDGSGKPVVITPWAFRHSDVKYMPKIFKTRNVPLASTGNTLAIGESGTGKTTLVNRQAHNDLKLGKRVTYIDSVGDMARIAHTYDGGYYMFSFTPKDIKNTNTNEIYYKNKMPSAVNPLQIINFQGDGSLSNHSDLDKTEIITDDQGKKITIYPNIIFRDGIIQKQLQLVDAIAVILDPLFNSQINAINQLNDLKRVIAKLYRANWKMFCDGVKPWPTFLDVREIYIKQYIDTDQANSGLSAKVERANKDAIQKWKKTEPEIYNLLFKITNDFEQILCRPTNLNFSKRLTVFDISELSKVGRDSPIMSLVSTVITSYITQAVESPAFAYHIKDDNGDVIWDSGFSIYLDEAHLYMNRKEDVFKRFISDTYKLIRKFNGRITVATQKPSDLINAGVTEVLDQANNIFIGSVSPDELSVVWNGLKGGMKDDEFLTDDLYEKFQKLFPRDRETGKPLIAGKFLYIDRALKNKYIMQCKYLSYESDFTASSWKKMGQKKVCVKYADVSKKEFVSKGLGSAKDWDAGNMKALEKYKLDNNL